MWEVYNSQFRKLILNLCWCCRSPLQTVNPVSAAKSRIDSGPPPLISIVPKSEDNGYMHSHLPPHSRPSVITSTNIMRRPVGFMGPSHLYGPAEMFCYPGPHRREIVESGIIDPFVEEHFRRSLGEDYKCVSPTSMSTAGSVDDHFAKALGDTWQKLKKSEVSTQSSNPPQLQSIISPANWVLVLSSLNTLQITEKQTLQGVHCFQCPAVGWVPCQMFMSGSGR